MRDSEKTIQSINDFISSKDKYCLVIGTDMQSKHLEILKYLNSLNKKLRILFRANSMQNLDSMFGSNKKRKAGTPYNIGNLTIYFDSMQNKSQQNTPDKFNCIIVYPIDSLKGVEDDNIQDIINYRKSEKVFWVSWSDDKNFNYIKEICNINKIITINHANNEIHERVLNNLINTREEELTNIEVDSLGYCAIESAIAQEFELGYMNSSNVPIEMSVGDFGEYILCGTKKSGSFIIKVKKHDNRYILLVKKIHK